ncbi:DUF2269 family protein [Gorillibacterium sp. sgz5001074]|uniref:DUF2269 family protein n=1 Tax=Gorillibacterium sp. sgz5001074 TaxID=3446695 RepID=UPI003F6644F2
MIGLVVLHVLSAVLGMGPAFAFPWMLKRTSSIRELQSQAGMVARLEVFPKIFGTLAVLSGLALFFAGSYGPFRQLWTLCSLVLFVLIEVLVIGYLNPAAVRLLRLADELLERQVSEVTPELAAVSTRVRNLHLWSGILGLAIFILMIVKPH